MKTNFTISIPMPCAQQWETFTPTAQGGHCGTCNKTVVDFTTMRDEEIVQFFRSQPTNTCGRFRSAQLKQYTVAPATVRPGSALLKAGLLGLLLLLNRQVTAQTPPTNPTEQVQPANATPTDGRYTSSTHVLKGVVRDKDDGAPIPGVSVWLRGSKVATTTDALGYFEFPERVKEGDSIVFSFIGMMTRELVIKKERVDEIIVDMACSADVLGAVALEAVYTPPTRVHTFWQRLKRLF